MKRLLVLLILSVGALAQTHVTGPPGGGATITAADTQVIFADGADTPSGDTGFTFVKATGTLSATVFGTTGTNGGLDCTEGTGAGLTAATSHDLFWCDSTAHRWKMNNNNGGAVTVGSLSDSVSVFAPPTVTVTTSTPITVSATNSAGYYFNEHATAGTAIVFNLPTAAAGKQFCFANAYNGSAANTGTLKLVPSATGQFIIFTDGTLTTNTTGYVITGGAAGDALCVVGVDATHWLLYMQRGTPTKA